MHHVPLSIAAITPDVAGSDQVRLLRHRSLRLKTTERHTSSGTLTSSFTKKESQARRDNLVAHIKDVASPVRVDESVERMIAGIEREFGLPLLSERIKKVADVPLSVDYDRTLFERLSRRTKVEFRRVDRPPGFRQSSQLRMNCSPFSRFPRCFWCRGVVIPLIWVTSGDMVLTLPASTAAALRRCSKRVPRRATSFKRRSQHRASASDFKLEEQSRRPRAAHPI